jgi:diphosphate--fructose-6-phosphate 1-phosphotransferase
MPKLTFEASSEAVEAKPLNAGVILSGGQAPGGHNVIAGIFDGIKKIHPDSRLYGFLMGPDGLVKHNYIELTSQIIDEYRNTGGFDIIGSGRTKLEEKEQFDKGLEVLKKLDIRALVIIGGDDSNTNAAVLAEYYKAIGAPVQVIGCPKTIDGDLKNEQIETSFGFDTATKVYAEVIGNIQRDCNSARKYWHFIKLMGRSASHIALECALQVRPNVAIISEEVEAKNLTLDDVVTSIAEVVAERAKNGENFGTVLIPEGLIEFVPAMKALIAELNDFLAHHEGEFRAVASEDQRAFIIEKLSKANSDLYASLPATVARQLTLDRDPHGNVQVSLIETEKLLAEMVGTKLAEWKKDGRFVGKFAPLTHFFGYEGRCAMPSNFDADYCYALGRTAACLIAAGVTGYMSSVQNLTAPAKEWIAGGIPTTMMMNMERRHGEMKPVIQKALVDLNGKPFAFFAAHRAEWAKTTSFTYPGPIQFYGPVELCDQPSRTLALEQGK